MSRRVAWGIGVPLAVLAILVSGASLGQEAAGAEPDTLVVWNRPIATFRAPVGGVPPAQRVTNAEARIAALPFGAEQAKVSVNPGQVGAAEGLMIAVGDRVVFGLVPGDIDPESDTTLEKSAAEAAGRVAELLAARAAQRDVRATLRGAAFSVLALAGLLITVWLVLRVRNALIGRLTALLKRRSVTIGGIDIIPTLAQVEGATFRVLSWALILGLAYLCLTFIFYRFPFTAPLGERLGGYVAAQLYAAGRSVALAMPSLLGVAAVLMVTRAISLWVSRLLVEVEHGLREVAWLAQEQAKATRRIASGVIWVLGIATAYPLLPWSDSRAFQGISVILGLAVSFASGGLINHWVSGLMVLYARSFRVGEFVGCGETEGTVTEMGALATKIRTMRREEVTIPNAVLASERLVNYTRLAGGEGMLLSASVAVGYDVPWQRVRQLMVQAAGSTPGVAAEPAPRVLAWELGEFNVRYELHVHLAPGTVRYDARAALNASLLDAFGAAGVQIMTPHYESQPERPVIAHPAGMPEEAMPGSHGTA